MAPHALSVAASWLSSRLRGCACLLCCGRTLWVSGSRLRGDHAAGCWMDGWMVVVVWHLMPCLSADCRTLWVSCRLSGDFVGVVQASRGLCGCRAGFQGTWWVSRRLPGVCLAGEEDFVEGVRQQASWGSCRMQDAGWMVVVIWHLMPCLSADCFVGVVQASRGLCGCRAGFQGTLWVSGRLPGDFVGVGQASAGLWGSGQDGLETACAPQCWSCNSLGLRRPPTNNQHLNNQSHHVGHQPHPQPYYYYDYY
jgi:hypothetical protein